MTDTTIGRCTEHGQQSGVVMLASFDAFTEGLGDARMTDTVMAACGDTGTIISTSLTSYVNGLGSARLGDTFVGKYSGTIVLGSFTHLVGD